ncbi:MAG TPA: hypothetical protein VGC07_08275 [Granulicella sp.]
MKMRHHVAAASLALAVVGSAAASTVMEKASASAATFATSSAPSQAEQGNPVPPAADAPLTRDQILKQGPAALEQNCNKCHGPDKWEGTNRDHNGWAAIVATMSGQMADAQMPPMSDKTTNLIIDYLTLTHPQ